MSQNKGVAEYWDDWDWHGDAPDAPDAGIMVDTLWQNHPAIMQCQNE